MVLVFQAATILNEKSFSSNNLSQLLFGNSDNFKGCKNNIVDKKRQNKWHGIAPVKQHIHQNDSKIGDQFRKCCNHKIIRKRTQFFLLCTVKQPKQKTIGQAKEYQ